MKVRKQNKKHLAELKEVLRQRRKRKLNIYENQSSKKGTTSTTVSARQGIETPDGLIDEVIAARLLGVTPRTLQNRRSLRQPPKFVHRGRRVFYELSYIEELATLQSRLWW